MAGENNTTASDYAYIPAGLGALGVALQNYQAVDSFLKSVIPAAQYSTRAMHAVAFGAGSVCSGMVNYKMNMDLLGDFLGRWKFEDYDAYAKEVNVEEYDFVLMSSLNGDLTQALDGVVYLSDNPKAYFVKGMQQAVCFDEEVDLTNLAEKLADIDFKKSILVITAEAAHTKRKYFDYKNATLLDQTKYFGGSLVVIVTGVLFGLMAFTFAMGSPLAMLSLVAGLFVTLITMIQELEAWLAAWDPKSGPATGLPQSLGEWCGYIIAVGNVLAFSLMFTLSLAETLILLQVAAVPALAIGAAVSFFFGGFTEYNFYAPYLTALCGQFGDKWQKMMETDWAVAGLLCMSTNAFVNAALTYASLELLTALLVASSIALPPVAVITALTVALTIFSGSASFLLGMNFWIGSGVTEDAVIESQNNSEPQDKPQDDCEIINPERSEVPPLTILWETGSTGSTGSIGSTSSGGMFGRRADHSDSSSDSEDNLGYPLVYGCAVS